MGSGWDTRCCDGLHMGAVTPRLNLHANSLLGVCCGSLHRRWAATRRATCLHMALLHESSPRRHSLRRLRVGPRGLPIWKSPRLCGLGPGLSLWCLIRVLSRCVPVNVPFILLGKRTPLRCLKNRKIWESFVVKGTEIYMNDEDFEDLIM